MNLNKMILGGATAAALTLLPQTAGATESAKHVAEHAGDTKHAVMHLGLGVEGSAHHGMLQGKGLYSLTHNVEVGAVAGVGMDSHKNPLFGLEALVALTAHIGERAGVVLEGTAGIELKKDHEVETEPVFKGALLGEYKFDSGLKGYAGSYVGKVGHDMQVGGTAGFIIGF